MAFKNVRGYNTYTVCVIALHKLILRMPLPYEIILSYIRAMGWIFSPFTGRNAMDSTNHRMLLSICLRRVAVLRGGIPSSDGLPSGLTGPGILVVCTPVPSELSRSLPGNVWLSADLP